MATASFEKQPLRYLNYAPPLLRSIYLDKQELIFHSLRTNLLIYYQSQRYDKIAAEILPVLPLLFKFYRPPLLLKAAFIELIAKSIFYPTREVLPKELVVLCESLQELIRGKFNGGFTFSWEPVLQLLDTVFNEQRRATEYFTRKDKLRLKISLQKIVQKLRVYFPIESGREIYDYLRPFIGPEKARKRVYLLYLNWLLRTDAAVPKEQYESWMKEMLLLWDSNSWNKEVSAVALSVISRLAIAHYEIDWTLYIDKFFALIPRVLPFHIKKFDFLINVGAGLVASEDRIYSNITNYAARLAIGLMRPHPQGKSPGITGLKQVVNSFKHELYPTPAKSRPPVVLLKFIERLLINMCLRLKRQRELPEEHKLRPVDLFVFTEFMMRVTGPVLYSLSTSNIVALSIYSIASLCPEIAFDHYTPMLLKLLDDPDRSHEATLCNMNALANALMFHPTFPKKFYYLSQILDCAIKETRTVISESCLFALNIVSRVLVYLPLTHKNCLKEEYGKRAKAEGSMMSYEEYLAQLKTSNELAFHYHVVLNGIEERVTVILEKIFAILKVQEVPSKKESSRALAMKIHWIMLFACSNSTSELFGRLLQQFKAFVFSGPYPNSKKELAVFVKIFAMRDPLATANVIVPYSFHALTTHEHDPTLWDSFLGKYVKEFLPEEYAVCQDYSLNTYMPRQVCKYYTVLIVAVIMKFPNCLNHFKLPIMILLTLSLVSPMKRASRATSRITNAILSTKTSFHYSVRLFEERTYMRNLLEAYDKIGQHDLSVLEVIWTPITKEGLVFCREGISKMCLGLGEHVLKGMLTSPGSEANGAAVTWVQIARKLVSGCANIVTKGNCEFSITRTLLERVIGEDKELLEFFLNVRPRLLKLANEIIPRIMPIFHMQIIQRLPKKTLDCLLSTICLSYRYEEPKRPVDHALRKLEKCVYRRPTERDHLRKYIFYYENIERLPFQIISCLEKTNEVPAPELRNAVCLALDVLMYTPSPVFFVLLFSRSSISSGFARLSRISPTPRAMPSAKFSNTATPKSKACFR